MIIFAYVLARRRNWLAGLGSFKTYFTPTANAPGLPKYMDRAIRENGHVWLIDEPTGYFSPDVPLPALGQALRIHFQSVYAEPMPSSLSQLVGVIEAKLA